MKRYVSSLLLCFFITSFCLAQVNNQTLNYSHGQYVGEVANGKANGQGVYTAKKSGTVYSGQFVNDTFSGRGTMSWTNGDRFVGIWQNDSATSGTMTFANGQSASGIVQNGIFKASTDTLGSRGSVNSSREDLKVVGECLGYLASQIQTKGMQNIHPTHQKYFSNHKNAISVIQDLNNSYPSCFAPGANIGGCLQSKGVSRSNINLVEGFNTGIIMNKQADSVTRATIDAACMG